MWKYIIKGVVVVRKRGWRVEAFKEVQRIFKWTKKIGGEGIKWRDDEAIGEGIGLSSKNMNFNDDAVVKFEWKFKNKTMRVLPRVTRSRLRIKADKVEAH